MNDKIGVENMDAVEDAPAPLHPRSESAAPSPREPTGGSPSQEEIDRHIERSLLQGKRKPRYPHCQWCGELWHGLPANGCRGSYAEGAR